MSDQKTKLEDMTFDEVSLVRRPANQHASIVFSKADEGGAMPGTILTEDGQEVDIDDLEVGTEIEFEDGQVFTVVDAEADEEADGGEPEPLEVAEYEQPGLWEEDEAAVAYGKSADYAEVVSKAFNEAVSDEERADVLAEVAKSAEDARQQALMAEARIEKMHAQEYLSECIAKADEYGFAGPRTEQLGVVIAKAMRVLDQDEIQLLDDIFKSFSALIDETEMGTEADGFSEVLDVVDGAAGDIVKSAGGEISKEEAMVAAFEANPALYQMYLEEKAGGL